MHYSQALAVYDPTSYSWQWFVTFSFQWMNCDAKYVVSSRSIENTGQNVRIVQQDRNFLMNQFLYWWNISYSSI